MVEEIHDDKVIIDKPIYKKHAQSLKSLNMFKETFGDLELKPGLKVSDIINNAVIVVQEGEDGNLESKAMNFSIYNSAYKMYSSTQEMFKSLSDEGVAEVILAHNPDQILGFIPTEEITEISAKFIGESTTGQEFSYI